MTCLQTNVPAADTLDIAALRERYAAERDKRLNTRGQEQYVRVSGEMNAVYAERVPEPFPARSAIEISEIPLPGALVEIEVVALA